MELTPEQQKLGKENFSTAVSVSRRDFLKGAVAGSTGLGAAYFGYEELKGEPVRTAFIGTGDEGNILLSEHPPKFMDVVAVADLRPSNQKRAIHGDGNDARIGLIRKVGKEKAGQVKIFDSHKDLLAAKDELGIEAVVIAVPLNQHQPIGLECLDAGLHVLTEKLMAHNIKQCKEWIRKAREKNLLLAVGHQRHYSVLYDNAASLVHDGLLGDIKFIRAQWHRNNSFPNSDQWNPGIKKEDMEALEGKVQEFGYESVEQLVRWRLFNGTGGGLMAELGSHQMDAASIFLGHVHPIAVSGYGGKNFYGVKGVGSLDKQDDPRDIDDHIYVTFEFPGPHYAEDQNDKAIVTYSSINTNRFEPYGEWVYGSRGTLIMKGEKEALLYKEEGRGSQGGGPDQRLWVVSGSAGGGPVLEAYETSSGSAKKSDDSGGWGDNISRGYTEEMEHFCYAIRNQGPDYYPGGKPLPREEGGLRCNGVVAMADAIMALTANRAMARHERVVFKDSWFDPDSPDTPEADLPLEGENPEDFRATV
ncbi:MAG: Gfo/Idh/MocA family oxidoreductase [Planctomycetaceae bacterium]|nr:Gfo/Idh/MocA family oxidoreductase [Planctomycetaceae bacterium]